jgi:photosystem II stability/assembly factor-like uncharacterized protein
MTATAILVVVLVTVTSVGAVVAYRQAHRGSFASGPRLTSPTPGAESPSVYLSAPSPDVVWALIDYDKLYLSTDRGGHWEMRAMPPSFGVRPTISFINEREGWLLAPGSPATQCSQSTADVWHTTDGAKSWLKLRGSGLREPQCKEIVYFSPDGSYGFITAWDPNHQPSVYFTPDRGVDWKPATLPDPPDFKSATGGFTLRVQWIKAVGKTLYLAAAGSQGAGSPYPDVRDRQYIFVSTNGGGTWVWKQKVASRELVVVTRSRWLEIDPPQLSESINGGQQIHPYESNLVVDAKAEAGQILFAGDSVGFVSRGGMLQRTLDGGAHWTRLGLPGSPATSPVPNPSPSPSPAYFMPAPVQLDAPTRDVVWAYIPFDKVLFLSIDRGDHWLVRNLPRDIGNTFPNVTFLDAEEGWFLSGSAGTDGNGSCATERVKLWHTTDGAETWEPVETTGISDAQCKLHLVFVDRANAFMTSEEENLMPRIYRSTDGGHTWSWTSLSDPINFQGVSDGFAFSAGVVKSFGSTELVDASGNGFLSSKAGSFAYRSDDGGAHWVLAAALPSGPGAVLFLSPTRWLMLQGPSGPVQTTDGGKTWQSFTTDYSDAAGVASEFVFADSQVGYGTVRGSFHRTVDGGAHWTMPTVPWMPAAG